MIPVLSREEMRAFDEHSIDECHVPSVVLMENAGRNAADVIERDVLGGSARGKRVAVMCGTGNNGGDGFVVARHLFARGAHVVAWLAGASERLALDASANHAAYFGIGGDVRGPDLASLHAALAGAHVAIDALFGTGLDRPITGDLALAIDAFNRASCPCAALDMPSGIDANTGAVLGVAVRAKLTVTFAHAKLGLLTPNGAVHAGRVVAVDIGVPPATSARGFALATERADVAREIAPRAADAHKYTAGHVAILGGANGKTGASALAALAAIRAGAGAATIVAWPESLAQLGSRPVEVMTALIDGDSGAARNHAIDVALAGKHAAVVGPGFGTDDRARAAVEHTLATFVGPLVLDADAITAYANRAADLAKVTRARVVMTPHSGELARLYGVASRDIESDRYTWAKRAAVDTGAVVVLKGPSSIIASPDGRVVINTTGGPALATAGSGDVLSGIVGASLASHDPFVAAWLGAWLHGAAGDAWSLAHGDRGLLASEIAAALPDVIASLARS